MNYSEFCSRWIDIFSTRSGRSNDAVPQGRHQLFSTAKNSDESSNSKGILKKERLF